MKNWNYTLFIDYTSETEPSVLAIKEELDDFVSEQGYGTKSSIYKELLIKLDTQEDDNDE